MTKFGVRTVYKIDGVLGNKMGNDDGWAWRSHASRFPSALSHIHRGRLRFYKVVESTLYDGRTRHRVSVMHMNNCFLSQEAKNWETP
jgi:hypothetical protein